MGEHVHFVKFRHHVLQHFDFEPGHPVDDGVLKIIRDRFRRLFSIGATVRDVKHYLNSPAPSIPLPEHKPLTGIASGIVSE